VLPVARPFKLAWNRLSQNRNGMIAAKIAAFFILIQYLVQPFTPPF
jgi:hypothetical protein